MWNPLSDPESAAWTDADPARPPRPIEAISASQPDAVLAGVPVDVMEGGFRDSAVWKTRNSGLGSSDLLGQDNPGTPQNQNIPGVQTRHQPASIFP